MSSSSAIDSRPGVIRYWGSHFKSPRQVAHWSGLFAPLLSRGWRCCLVVERLPEERAWLAELERAGIEVLSIARPRRQLDWSCIRAVRALCARFRADVFHCENIHTSPTIGAWLARVPVRVWQKHSMFVHYEECRPPAFKERLALSTRLTGRLATKVLCVSESVAAELRTFGVSPEKVLVRNNPRPARAASKEIDQPTARKQFGLGQSDFVVAAVGHTVPVKGWDVLVKSFGEVARAVPGAKLLLAGSHSAPAEAACHEQLRQLCVAERIEDRVLFTGHLPDVTPVLCAADVFALPSRSEGNSYSLLEALEEGLPCVATKVGAAPELIQDGVNGFLVERLDVNGLARALIQLSNPELRASLARCATVPDFVPAFDEYAEQMRRDYESLLGRSTNAPSVVARQPA